MRQLELDFDAVPGIIRLAPYLTRPQPKPMRNRESESAVIKAFPLSRQRSTIQDVALRFRSKRGKARQTFWQETIAELGEGLRRSGLAEGSVRRQLIAFRDAVERELCPGSGSHFGGAA
jgi:hypothetical protein